MFEECLGYSSSGTVSLVSGEVSDVGDEEDVDVHNAYRAVRDSDPGAKLS